jgi:hypothetical protein
MLKTSDQSGIPQVLRDQIRKLGRTEVVPSSLDPCVCTKPAIIRLARLRPRLRSNFPRSPGQTYAHQAHRFRTLVFGFPSNFAVRHSDLRAWMPHLQFLIWASASVGSWLHRR